jgi:hypothetical protein
MTRRAQAEFPHWQSVMTASEVFKFNGLLRRARRARRRPWFAKFKCQPACHRSATVSVRSFKFRVNASGPFNLKFVSLSFSFASALA